MCESDREDKKGGGEQGAWQVQDAEDQGLQYGDGLGRYQLQRD